MQKNKSNFAKIKIIVAIFAALSVLSVLFMEKVSIKYNLADYLGKDTQTKIALDIMENEFGATGNLQVMAKNVSSETAEQIKEKIENVPNVKSVSFDGNSNAYYKDGNALFLVMIDGDDYSDNAKQVMTDIQSALDSYNGLEYGGATAEKNDLRNAISGEMVLILVVALCLVVGILLITSESWIEPLILLAASGVAILINRGTNIFFGSISYITNSIAAILQLALSIGYSIVLLHTYRREKKSISDNSAAMRTAIKTVTKPISASALTTIAGLLALLFMSFRIGFDIGIVLMKGIVISAITSVTLLPALVLLPDGLMKKTHKNAFVPTGKGFCRIAARAGKVIVPIALVLVILCGVLQTGNGYLFTDTKAGNASISDVFGKNNSVIVIYKNSENNPENEKKFADLLENYRTKDGKSVLTNYAAYSNTVKELYTPEKAAEKMDLSVQDAGMLFAMYHLYLQPDNVKIKFSDFIAFAKNIAANDPDVKDFVDADTVKTVEILQLISEITKDELTADELYEKLTYGIPGNDISLFSVKQLYGLYFYDRIPKKTVDFKTILNFIATVSEDGSVGTMLDRTTAEQLKALSGGIAQFEAKMEMPMDQAPLKGWFYQNCGVLLSDSQLTQIYTGYYAAAGETPKDTIPFLPLMKFLVAGGQVTDTEAIATINQYDKLLNTVHGSYGYEEFLAVFSQIATALTGDAPHIIATVQSVQQIYIMYFYRSGTMPIGKMSGKAFAEFALDADKTNPVVHAQLSEENRDRLTDLLTVAKYCSDDKALNYEEAYKTLSVLQSEVKSVVAGSALEKDKISGVYIKYANQSGTLNTPIAACDLLNFVCENMDTNSLLENRLTTEKREKIDSAKADMTKAEDLFFGKEYSRMLLSVNLPNESNDTSEFVAYLSDEVKDVFGTDAYITGEIVSTYDLQQTFDHDNRFITIFTLISIFLIVMIIFRSLSLPVILVAVIQGAIFIAMSTQLLGNGIFFMSYIVTTCILMGATIDYGILMSSNYVSCRKDHDRREALEFAVAAAMPTIFTSGLILTVCGFVIHFVSSQNSISTVGLLIGIGTICSVVMITIVLPAILFVLDKFVLALSLGNRKGASSDNRQTHCHS